MGRFKEIKVGTLLLPVDLSGQIMPGSFEEALCYLIDNEISLSELRDRYKNDEEGASAYDPGVLLKIVLLAYSRGMISSRRIEAACRENVLFMAVSGDSHPHFTTIAAFISALDEDVAKLFAQVLVICDRQGLIGRELFAIDGVKLPSNASKEKSGTRADYQRHYEKMEKKVKGILERHKAIDKREEDGTTTGAKATAQLERLRRDMNELKEWLEKHPEDKKGPKGTVRQSNITDNESAKMATGKGVVQGYTGVAVVDEKHQIIVESQAHGTGSEQELLEGAVEAAKPYMAEKTLICADAGYYSTDGLAYLEDEKIEAYIPDPDYRKRDERYAGKARHLAKPSAFYDKKNPPKKAPLYTPEDFTFDVSLRTCVCPAGKSLYRHGENCTIGEYRAMKFQGAKQDCGPCSQREKCLRFPEKTEARQVALIMGKVKEEKESPCDRMKRKIDQLEGKDMIARRFATVEPVFGNIRNNKRLDRFTLRGKNKVNIQWRLYCLVHNIEKLANCLLEKREDGMEMVI